MKYFSMIINFETKCKDVFKRCKFLKYPFISYQNKFNLNNQNKIIVKNLFYNNLKNRV